LTGVGLFEQQARDKMKNIQCEKANIKLIRIKYTEYNLKMSDEEKIKIVKKAITGYPYICRVL